MSPLTLRLAASVCFDFPDEAAAWPVSLVPSLEVSHQVDLRLSGVHPGAQVPAGGTGSRSFPVRRSTGPRSLRSLHLSIVARAERLWSRYELVAGGLLGAGWRASGGSSSADDGGKSGRFPMAVEAR